MSNKEFYREIKTINVQGEVLKERAQQEAKWGEQNHDPLVWLSILTEEVGEVAKAILETYNGVEDPEEMRLEAIQVAAVAVAFIECLDRAKWNWRQEPKEEK